MKTCTKCGESKPLAEFSKKCTSPDGKRSHCKKCDGDRARLWRADKQEHLRSYHAAYRGANRDKRNAYNKAYSSANRDKVNALNTAWCAANPEKVRVKRQNYSARKKAGGGRLSSDLVGRLYKLQRGKCACCGLPLGDDFHLDHIMPLARGGSNTDDNIQLLRSRCNRQKMAKHPVDFMRERGFLI